MTYLEEPGICMSAFYNQLILKHFYKKVKTHFLTPNILDAGSGLGFNLPTIFDIWPKADVVALDICKEALEVSKFCCNREEIISYSGFLKEEFGFENWVVNKLLESRGLSYPGKRVDIITDDIINYEKNNKGLFEIVICTEVLQLVHHPEESLAALSRLINRGGYLILSFPNYYRNTAAFIKKHKDNKKDTPNWSPWSDPWGANEERRENPTNWLTIEKIVNKLDFTITDRKAANYFLAWIPYLAKKFKRKKCHNLGDSFPMIRLGDLFPCLRRFAMSYFILAKQKT